MTDLCHGRGSNGTFWGIRRERSPLAGGVAVKGRGNSGRFQKEGEKGGGQTLTFIQRVLSEYLLQARLGAALGWELPGPALPLLLGLLWEEELRPGATHLSYGWGDRAVNNEAQRVSQGRGIHGRYPTGLEDAVMDGSGKM